MSFLDFIGDGISSVLDFAENSFEYITENPVKSAIVASTTIASGGIALAAAPSIAASIGSLGVLGSTATTGTVISTLSGQVLTNASLAAIGGGAIAAGGGGIATGTTAIASVGSITGGTIATTITHKK